MRLNRFIVSLFIDIFKDSILINRKPLPNFFNFLVHQMCFELKTFNLVWNMYSSIKNSFSAQTSNPGDFFLWVNFFPWKLHMEVIYVHEQYNTASKVQHCIFVCVLISWWHRFGISFFNTYDHCHLSEYRTLHSQFKTNKYLYSSLGKQTIKTL